MSVLPASFNTDFSFATVLRLETREVNRSDKLNLMWFLWDMLIHLLMDRGYVVGRHSHVLPSSTAQNIHVSL